MSEHEGDVRQARLLINEMFAVLRGDQSRTTLMERLQEHQQTTNMTMLSFVNALLATLDALPGSVTMLLAVSGSVLHQGQFADQASAYQGIAGIANILGETETELEARKAAIECQRQAGESRAALMQLSSMLHNLATLYQHLEQYDAALPLLQEVVAIDEQIGHPELPADRAALEALQLQVTGPRAAIERWLQSYRDEDGLQALLNLVEHLAIGAMREDNRAQREALAEHLARLRAIRDLPIEGAYDFLHVLQLWLRNEPGMAQKPNRYGHIYQVISAKPCSQLSR
ncbi:MAG: tetratricopeptide repeat protein [Chloroflexaceae bacterium]|nr:tetratricopeptide repeat protein [Chloroflexaceae bacterium]